MASLSLPEQLLLLAFDPDRGKPTANPQIALPFALAGAVVIEEGTADPKEVKREVKRLAGRRENLQGKLLDRLVERGILEPRDARVVGFKIKRHTLRDGEARAQVLAELRDAVTAAGPATSLAALAGTCGLVDRAVDKDQRKAARRQATALAKGDVAGRAVKSAVEEVEAAVTAGVTAVIVAASASSSGHGH